ncbi:MAG: hypothetical protein WA126_12090 [Thermodesulfovibrionales bacterium]
MKPLSNIMEETLRSLDYKKIIEDHKWLISGSASLIKSLNQQYDILQSYKSSTFLNLIGEVTHYQANWKRTLEIFDNNISGLGSQILHDVINIDEFVKVEISEAITAPEVSFSDVIQRTLSEILNKIDELVKSNQTKPIIRYGWIKEFLSLIVSILISFYIASKDEKFLKLKFKEQEILIQESIKKISDKIDAITKELAGKNWTET